MPNKNDIKAFMALCLQVIEDDLGHYAGISSEAIHEAQESVDEKCATTFCSALVLGALNDARNAGFLVGRDILCGKLAAFLDDQHDADGTWNYWRKGTAEHERYRCPNDLDDTALAVEALWAQRNHQVSGGAASGSELGSITKALIAAEASVGGPYRTWVVSPEQADWQDVDLAVNANIAWMLQSQGISLASLPGLHDYIASAITSHAYGSSYYAHPELVWHFLSRLHLSKQYKEILLGDIHRNLSETKSSGSMLRIALAICAIQELCYVDRQPVHELMDLLCAHVAAAQEDFTRVPHWLERICLERSDNGVQRWCVSSSVTAAFCVQAYAGYLSYEDAVQNDDNEPVSDSQRQDYLQLLQTECETFLKTLPADLACSAREMIQFVTKGNQSSEVHMHAYDASGMPLEVRAHVGAHLFGWSAYAIYDGCLDGETRMQRYLPAANACCREMYRIHEAVLQSMIRDQVIDEAIATKIRESIRNIFTNMDNAYVHELQARTAKRFIGFDAVVYRAMGYVLPHLFQMIYAGVRPIDDTWQAMMDWFGAYIVAKQLHDDMHDWLDDLSEGNITYPVALIKDNFFAGVDIFSDSSVSLHQDMHQHVLASVLPNVARVILEYLDRASQANERLVTHGLSMAGTACAAHATRLREGAERAIAEAEHMGDFLKVLHTAY